MFEPTLSHLGKFLAEKSGLPIAQVRYADRELIFYHLSLDQLPMELPAIAFSMPEISDPQMLRPMKTVGDYNTTFTSIRKIDLIPLDMTINIVLLTNNLSDYLFLSKVYYLLVKDREFTVHLKPTTSDVGIDGHFNCQLQNHSGLSTPPGGREGKDFDRGRYFVTEGSFEVNTYAAFSKDVPVIRDIRLKGLTEIQVIGG